MMVRDPSAYSARDEMIESAEDEYDAALGALDIATAFLRKQRGDLTDSAINDAINGLRDIASELRGAKNALAEIYHGERAA
jgi:hypothetical protein